MSRAYEQSLANQISRLDRLIAVSETWTSQTPNGEMLRSVKADLARWRESREWYSAKLRRTKVVNRVALWTLRTFWVSFGLLCGISPILSKHELIQAFFVGLDLLLVVGSGAAYLVAIATRDAIALGRQPWRFSVRSLLIIMTVIGLLLGLWFWGVRY